MFELIHRGEEALKVIRKVTIKQVITDETKVRFLHKLKQEQLQLKKECQQLLFEQKKLERARKLAQGSLTPNFTKQIEKRQNRIKTIDFQLEQMDILPIGTEIIEGETQAIIDINEGDQWDGVTKEIIIENGVVKEIRKG